MLSFYHLVNIIYLIVVGDTLHLFTRNNLHVVVSTGKKTVVSDGKTQMIVQQETPDLPKVPLF